MPRRDHHASVIAVHLQLVDQLGDPSHLGAGRGPDVPLLHGGRLTPSSEAHGRTGGCGSGRARPELTASTDGNLHLKRDCTKPVPPPPPRDTKRTQRDCSPLSALELPRGAF